MNPTFKKYLEIFIVIFGLFLIIYFIAYKFYFTAYCSKYSQKVIDYKTMNLYLAGECKTNYFCEMDNKKYNLGKLTEYSCIKQNVELFEKKYYIDFITTITKKIGLK